MNKKLKRNTACLFKKIIVTASFILVATSFQVNAENLAELEKQLALYTDLVRDPNVILVPIPITSQNYDIFPPCFDTQRGWYKKNELEDRIQRCLLNSPHKPTYQAYEDFFLLLQMGSNKEKNYLIQNDIPQLKAQIAQLKASHGNSGWGGTKSPTIERWPNGTIKTMIRYYNNGNKENKQEWDQKGKLIKDTSYYNDGGTRLVKIYWTSSDLKLAKELEYPCSGCKPNLSCYNLDASRRYHNCNL
jgi:hypothetical protein